MSKLEREIKAFDDEDMIVLAGQILAVATDFVDVETGKDAWLPVVRLVRSEIKNRRLEKRLCDLMFDVTIRGGEAYEATRGTRPAVLQA